MVGGNKDVIQVLASLFPLGRLLVLQNILHERGLIRGKTLPTAAKIEKSVAVFEENWREICSRFGHGLPGCVLGIGRA